MEEFGFQLEMRRYSWSWYSVFRRSSSAQTLSQSSGSQFSCEEGKTVRIRTYTILPSIQNLESIACMHVSSLEGWGFSQSDQTIIWAVPRMTQKQKRKGNAMTSVAVIPCKASCLSSHRSHGWFAGRVRVNRLLLIETHQRQAAATLIDDAALQAAVYCIDVPSAAVPNRQTQQVQRI
jgi:hypothetical protein